MTIESLISKYEEELNFKQRPTILSQIKRLILSYEGALTEAKRTDSDRKQSERTRKALKLLLPGRPTKKETQFLMQMIEYVLYFDEEKGLSRKNDPFCSQVIAFKFIEELCYVLKWKTRSEQNPEYLLKNLKKSCKTYVPGTLPGLPAGYRYNSALGGPRVIKCHDK